MKIEIPELCLVLLVGASGSGKSTFANKHFKSTEVINSDHCRALVCDDALDQSVSPQAFELLRFIAASRLKLGRFTVIDATNILPDARREFLTLARENDVLPVAIAFDMPLDVCLQRNAERSDRQIPVHAVKRQANLFRRHVKGLKREGFNRIFKLSSVEDMDNALIERKKLWNDKRDLHGPFDIIGDVHGCFDELVELLGKLRWEVNTDESPPSASHPQGRTLLFLGDLVDRGPKTPAVLRLVMNMVNAGTAICVPGNHDVRLYRALQGKKVNLTHGLVESMEQMNSETETFRSEVMTFIDGLVSHYVLDNGNLVIAHAGMKEQYQGRTSGRVRSFALYSETTGETDEFGLPVLHDWVSEYRGKAMVVYGHTPIMEPEWRNGTLCIDTGCVFGGSLTSLRYPEREIVQVQAHETYYEPVKPIGCDNTDDRLGDDILDFGDVSKKRHILTRLRGAVSVQEENAAAALEMMTRFAVDPHWLIYLPPTMSPSETSPTGDMLEHPVQCLDYYRAQGQDKVICQEKHMGSRAIVVVCKNEETGRKRFQIKNNDSGCIYTRTGRPFFNNDVERLMLQSVRTALDKVGFWKTFQSDWFCFDCELLPWSAKAMELLRKQYAPTGAAAVSGLGATAALLRQAAARDQGSGYEELQRQVDSRLDAAQRYVQAYRRYCWQTQGLEGLKLAPFHLMASEGAVHTDKDHTWHMEMLRHLCNADSELFHSTNTRIVHLEDQKECEKTINWWENLTAAGGEGMVVKALGWHPKGRRGLIQPAMKCRGKEYLRIIYGPDYNLPADLKRLRSRSLGAKRSLALQEYALGLEALHRFVEGEPLYRVHECVFGVMAMESTPVDPRL